MDAAATRTMFHIFELGEGNKYDVPPSKTSLALCMAVAKRCLSKSTNIEILDMICANGSKATEENVEVTVLEITGMRTPWLKYTLPELMEKFEDKAGIVTWEMVLEAGGLDGPVSCPRRFWVSAGELEQS
jgi:hypothetical protein